MMRCLSVVLTTALLNGLSVSVMGGEPVGEFKGFRSGNTPEFEAQAPWVLDWRVLSEFPESLAIDVALMEAGTGIHLGNVLKTKRSGNGVRLFELSGKFYFQVNSSMANWTFKVESLSDDEAASYTPLNAEG